MHVLLYLTSFESADGTRYRQQQSLQDKISQQQQESLEQAGHIQDLYSQIQTSKMAEQQQAEQVKGHQALITQLKSEIAHLKGKLAADSQSCSAAAADTASAAAHLETMHQDLQSLKQSEKTAAAQHEAMTGHKHRLELQLEELKDLLCEKDTVISGMLAQLEAANTELTAKDAAVLKLEQQVKMHFAMARLRGTCPVSLS